MNFVESNSAFQEWAGEPRVDPEFGGRVYGSAFGPEVFVREGDNHFQVSVFVDSSEGVTAAEWFGQFFPPDDFDQQTSADGEREF